MKKYLKKFHKKRDFQVLRVNIRGSHFRTDSFFQSLNTHSCQKTPPPLVSRHPTIRLLTTYVTILGKQIKIRLYTANVRPMFSESVLANSSNFNEGCLIFLKK